LLLHFHREGLDQVLSYLGLGLVKMRRAFRATLAYKASTVSGFLRL